MELMTFTLKNHNDPVEKITYSLTVRDGWNMGLMAGVTANYFEAVKTLRKGERECIPMLPAKLLPLKSQKTDSDDLELVQIWGELEIKTSTGSFKFSCNRFNEHMTAQQLVNEAWALYDALQALEMERLLDKAQAGERAATLQPDTPYPVPNATPRVLRDGELPTMQAAVASRKRQQERFEDEGHMESWYAPLPELDKD